MPVISSYDRIENAAELIDLMNRVKTEHAAVLTDLSKAQSAGGDLQYFLSWSGHRLMESTQHNHCAESILAAFPEDGEAQGWLRDYTALGRYKMTTEGIEEPQTVRNWLHLIYHECRRNYAPSTLSSRSTNPSSNFMDDCKAHFYNTLAQCFDLSIVANYATKVVAKRDADRAEMAAQRAAAERARLDAERDREEAKKNARRERRAARKAATA